MWLPDRHTHGWTDARQSDPYLPLCFTGDSKRSRVKVIVYLCLRLITWMYMYLCMVPRAQETNVMTARKLLIGAVKDLTLICTKSCKNLTRGEGFHVTAQFKFFQLFISPDFLCIKLSGPKQSQSKVAFPSEGLTNWTLKWKLQNLKIFRMTTTSPICAHSSVKLPLDQLNW